MSNRTPTPWHFEELDRRPDGCGYLRCAADNLEISHHGDMGRSREENLANAAFIVTASNHFDDLIACVRASLNMVDGDGSPPDWDFLRRTLKSAEGK